MALTELPACKPVTDHLVMKLLCIDDRVAIDLPGRSTGDVRTAYAEGICTIRAGSTGPKAGVPVRKASNTVGQPASLELHPRSGTSSGSEVMP